MDRTDESKRLGRRRALQVFGAGLTALGGMVLLESCKSKDADTADAPAAAPKPAAAAGGPLNCGAQDSGDDAARAMRQTLQYKEKTNQAPKACSNCSQFEAARYGACGGCKLFAGAVNPNGICLSYAPVKPG